MRSIKRRALSDFELILASFDFIKRKSGEFSINNTTTNIRYFFLRA